LKIFERLSCRLQTPNAPHSGVSERIQNRIAELAEYRDIVTTVDMTVALDTVAGELAAHAEAVVTEAVSNAVRHAEAGHVTVRVHADHQVVLEIIDDGHGIPAGNNPRSGLANMQRRAEQAGGNFSITAAPGGGARVYWTAPLS
jgi:signal transduction histidine kinase